MGEKKNLPKGPPPLPHKTVEVDMAWLEESSPAPPRRDTIEVKMEWLKIRERGLSSIPPPYLPESMLAKFPIKMPPLPREEPADPAAPNETPLRKKDP